MIRLLALLIVILLPCSAWATTTWTVDAPEVYAKAVCSSGTESAPTLVTEGLSLTGVKGVVVSAEAASAMTAGGKFLAYVWVPQANSGDGQWHRAADLDLTATAVVDETYSAFQVLVPRAGYRVAWVPSGIGVAVTLHIVGSNR